MLLLSAFAVTNDVVKPPGIQSTSTGSQLTARAPSPAGPLLSSVQSRVWEVTLDFLRAAGNAAEGLTPATPFMDAGLDSLDMLKLAR